MAGSVAGPSLATSTVTSMVSAVNGKSSLERMKLMPVEDPPLQIPAQ